VNEDEMRGWVGRAITASRTNSLEESGYTALSGDFVIELDMEGRSAERDGIHGNQLYRIGQA